MKNCKCSSCGATLSFTDDREFGFCEYCGAKIQFDDYRYTQRIVDEAKIKQTEVEREIKLRQLAFEEEKFRAIQNEREKSSKTKKNLLIATIILALILTLAGVIAYNVTGDEDIYAPLFLLAFAVFVGGLFLVFKVVPEREERKTILNNGGILTPKFSSILSEMNYQAVYEILIKAGFTNIKTINLHDVKVGIIQKPNLVESITIDGKSYSENKPYLPDVPIIITYHGFIFA